MKRLKKTLFAAALVAGLLAAASAQADVHWQADWIPSDTTIIAGPKSSINFTNLKKSGYTTTAALPVISTPATNLTIITSLKAGEAPESFSKQAYKLSLDLTDNDSGAIKRFDFVGYLSGTISNAGSSVFNLFEPLTDFQTWTAPSGNHYTIDLNGYVAPGSGDNINTQGAIGADITVVAGEGGGQVHETPEPSSMALAGLGMAFTSLIAWRRRRLGGANRNAS